MAAEVFLAHSCTPLWLPGPQYAARAARQNSGHAGGRAKRLPNLFLGGEFGRPFAKEARAPTFSASRRHRLGLRAYIQLSGPAITQWAVRMAVYYVLLKSGLAGATAKAQTTSGAGGAGSAWVQAQMEAFQRLLFGSSGEKRERELTQLGSRWHASPKGTLVRRYRVPNVGEGKRLLRAVCDVLSEDDLFRELGSSKGCSIRRESAHGESVCCNNVRALFDENPTPHLVIEITVFPPGPITSAEYQKAGKLESVLRKKGQSI